MMISETIHLLCLLLLSTVVYAEYPLTDNSAYMKANACARNCAVYLWAYEGELLCGQFGNDAPCLCETANGYSNSMNVLLSMCPTLSSCGGSYEATQATAIFSAYCSMNGVGAAAAATTGGASNPTNVASAGQSPATAFATPTSDSSGSSSSDSNNSNGNGLSMSDKIAIACAIGGAVVTIAVAVPTWLHMRKKKRANAPEAQPLHPPPYPGPSFNNPIQQPLYPQPPYQPHVYQNQGWNQGWRS